MVCKDEGCQADGHGESLVLGLTLSSRKILRELIFGDLLHCPECSGYID